MHGEPLVPPFGLSVAYLLRIRTVRRYSSAWWRGGAGNRVGMKQTIKILYMIHLDLDG